MELIGDVDIIVNTVNTKGYMGKGLALEFKLRFPDIEKDYKEACNSGELGRGGDLWIWKGEDIFGREAVIVNMATKEDYKKPSNIKWIERGMENLISIMSEGGYRSVALPKLGAGLGGLDWDLVENRIVETFHDMPYEVVICKDLMAGPLEKSLMKVLEFVEVSPKQRESLIHALRRRSISRLRDLLKIRGIGEKAYRDILKKAWIKRKLV